VRENEKGKNGEGRRRHGGECCEEEEEEIDVPKKPVYFEHSRASYL